MLTTDHTVWPRIHMGDSVGNTATQQWNSHYSYSSDSKWSSLDSRLMAVCGLINSFMLQLVWNCEIKEILNFDLILNCELSWELWFWVHFISNSACFCRISIPNIWWFHVLRIYLLILLIITVVWLNNVSS